MVRWLERYLRLRGMAGEKCLLGVWGVGKQEGCGFRPGGDLQRVVRDHSGVNLGLAAGRQWYKNRFLVAYLRNSLWEAGYAVDTLEMACTLEQGWSTG